MAIEQKIDELVTTLQRSTDTMERLIEALGSERQAPPDQTQQPVSATPATVSRAPAAGDAFAGLGEPAGQPPQAPTAAKHTAIEQSAVKQNDVIAALLDVGKRFGRNGIVDVLSRFDASTAMDPKLEGRYNEVMAAINDKLAE